MPLPQFSRIIVTNNSGSTLDYSGGGRLQLNVDGVFIDPDTGKITYTNVLDDVSSVDFNGDVDPDVVDGAEIKFEEMSNTANLFLGYQVQLKVTHDLGAAADGNFDIFLDGGRITGELSSDSSGYASAEANFLQHIGSLVWEPNAANGEIMRSEVIDI